MPEPLIVVIGASAGGLQALTDLVANLSEDFNAAIFVAVHTRTDGNSLLPQILSRSSPAPVVFAEQGMRVTPGTIVIAPPDHHLLVLKHRIELNRGPKENGFRPAVDPLFRSAARAHGAAVMGVILSGALDDGSYGMKTIKDAGGIAVVQHPEEASHPGMPLSAMRVVKADHVLRAADIGRLISECQSTDEGGTPMARRQETEPQDPADETTVQEMKNEFGPPSALTCPDCGGALWEIHNGELTRFRCHVGHQYSTESLDAEQQQVVEGALWSAVRILEERADLRRRMAKRADERGMTVVSAGFDDSARESAAQASTIRALLFSRESPDTVAASAGAEKPAAPRARARRRAR